MEFKNSRDENFEIIKGGGRIRYEKQSPYDVIHFKAAANS
jgi:protein-L-isoaspartate O-methyltransferase